MAVQTLIPYNVPYSISETPDSVTKLSPEMTEGKMADRASKSRPPPPPPLAQGLDLPLIEVQQFDQYVVHVDGSGRITLVDRKFLRRYVPIQASQPRRIIHDDFRHITKLPSKPATSPILWPTTCLPTIPAFNQPTPEPTPSQGPTSTVPTTAGPAHPSSSYLESAVSTPPCPIPELPPPEVVVEPQQTIANLPPTLESPSALTPPVHPNTSPTRQHWH